MTNQEKCKCLLDDLLHQHLTHDQSDSFLVQLEDYNLMSYEETGQGFNLLYAGEKVGTIKPLDNGKFNFTSVNDAIDHYNDSYNARYHVLEDLLYVVFTDGI